MVKWSSYLDHQLSNDQTRDMKLMRSIESSDPKILAAIAKVETVEELKTDFEAIEAWILPHDHWANNKAYSNANDKCSVSDAVIVSMVGGIDQENKLDLRFYDFKEWKTLGENDKSV